MNDEPCSYNLSVIRELLHACFTPETLRRFCLDDPTFRPIYDEFGPGQGLTDMVDRLMLYCETRLLFDDLLDRLRAECPRQYERFRPELYESRQPGAGTGYFDVPFPRNPGFVGREEDLARLHEAVHVRPTVLVGLGGMGKTQLAVEYAHVHRADYPDGVYWLNAVNPLLGELAALARRLGLAGQDTPGEQAARGAWSYLDSRPEALAIFDNVEEPSRLAEPLGPGMMLRNLHCRALLSTRQRDLPFGFQPFEIGALPEPAALRLLLSGRPEVRDDERDPEWGWARVACLYLGRLPLAVALAGAYLKSYPEVTVQDYVAGLRDEGALALIDDSEVRFADLPTHLHELVKAQARDEDLAQQSYVAVTATLRTQWHRLDPAADEAARRLFRAAGQFPKATWIPAAWLGLLAGVETTARPGRAPAVSRALRRLQAISLVEGPAQGRVYLHPLVHDFARRLIPEDELPRYHLELEDNLIASLQAPDRPAGVALAAGQCLIDLPWPPSRMRAEVLRALRAVVTGQGRPEAQRAAAVLLERLRWLDDAQAVSRAELLAYLRFAERVIYRREDWSQVVHRIAPLLAGASSGRQRAYLHAYQATFLARLDDLDQAEQEYARAQEALDRLDPAEREAGDHHLAAWIRQGQANILVARELSRREEGGKGDDAELETAVDLYHAAAKEAENDRSDVAFAVGIYTELSHALGMVGSWNEAEAWYRKALAELGKEENPEAWVDRYALILRNAGLMHWAKGNDLAEQGRMSEARAEFETAHGHALAEIDILGKLSEPRDLAVAHYNAGDYLLAMSEVESGCEPSRCEPSRCEPGGAQPRLLAEACEEWRMALATAQGLGLEGLDPERRAQWADSLDAGYRKALREVELAACQRLEEHCPGGAPEGCEELLREARDETPGC